MKTLLILLLIPLIITPVITGCAEQSPVSEPTDTPAEEPVIKIEVLERESKIPADAVKMTPETDAYPPQIHSDEYGEPVPMPGPINTAGAEDSPFILPDGKTFYFVFVPDVRVPVEK